MTVRQILFFGLCMSVVMSAAMAAAMVIINVGLNSHFFKAWLSGFGTGFLVSLPFSFFLPPLIQKVIAKLHIQAVFPKTNRVLGKTLGDQGVRSKGGGNYPLSMIKLFWRFKDEK